MRADGFARVDCDGSLFRFVGHVAEEGVWGIPESDRESMQLKRAPASWIPSEFWHRIRGQSSKTLELQGPLTESLVTNPTFGIH